MKSKTRKMGLLLGACLSIMLCSSIIVSAAGTYFSLTPPGYGKNVYTAPVTKTTSNDFAVVKCVKSQNDHYMDVWLSDYSKNCISDTEEAWTNHTTSINYDYSGSNYVKHSIRLSSDTDGYYGYNFYGNWSPDNY